jgi:hypothetical protein
MGFLKRLLGRKKSPSVPVAAHRPQVVQSKPSFPLGENIISDPDVKTVADLGRLYPLPTGFAYREDAQGVPYVHRASDGKRFKFLVEADLLTFDEPYTRENGKTGYKTMEVFKRG